ncbi:MAG: glycerate kinase [Oscillospiraceae bacterium]|nr:glycerate kinase [Oscillospiraceae bacterium]
MKVVTAIDSFKGSLTSLEAGEAVRRGVLRALPDAQVTVRPLADGGEGTVEALVAGMGGRRERVVVTGPLGRPVEAVYGILDGSGTAIIEMSAAAGITLVPEEERDPLLTTTYGVGEMIRDAMAKGCRRFLIGIGGSATNDGGIGMLQALGFGILDRNGKPAAFGAGGLADVSSITDEGVLPELRDCTFRVACDVTNPLCGERGASVVYGPQKGAGPALTARMDGWMADFAALCRKRYPHADPDRPGSGAAGGLGFAFLTFTNASLESGIRIVLEETRLEGYIREADVVVTGEGRLDGQTVMGKAPAGVAEIAKRYGKLVVAFSGCVTEDAAACNRKGIDAFFPILRGPSSLQEAMAPENAGKNLSAAAEQAFRLIAESSRLSYR